MLRHDIDMTFDIFVKIIKNAGGDWQLKKRTKPGLTRVINNNVRK